MGVTQSSNNIEFNKSLYIVIDLYLQPKFEEKHRFDINNFKTNSFLKKKLKDIIVNSLINKYNCDVTLSENNIILVSKTDSNNIKYLEMNAIVEFSNITQTKSKPDIIPTSTPTYIYPNDIIYNNLHNVTIEILKMNVLRELYEYVSNKYEIFTPDITLIISHQTIYNIHMFQKKL